MPYLFIVKFCHINFYPYTVLSSFVMADSRSDSTSDEESWESFSEEQSDEQSGEIGLDEDERMLYPPIFVNASLMQHMTNSYGYGFPIVFWNLLTSYIIVFRDPFMR